jgi:hypothetical protein
LKNLGEISQTLRQADLKRPKNLTKGILDGKYKEPEEILPEPEQTVITEHDWYQTPIFKE